MTNKPGNPSKLSRCIRAPSRLLGKVRNLYVGCMYNCAEWVSHGDDLGLPPGYFSSLPIRAFSSKDNNDLRDLIGANSKPITMNKVGSKIEIGSKSELVKKLELEILQLRQQRQSQVMAKEVQRMKCCEVIETIDEDKPCEFSDDWKVRNDFLQQPGCRGCVGTKRIGVID